MAGFAFSRPRWHSKRALASRPFPPEWRPLAIRAIPHYRALADWEREDLEEIALSLMVYANWEAAQGFELTDEICVTIAAQAALLALGLDDGVYNNVDTVIVHPTTMVFARAQPGPVPGLFADSPVPLLGEAHYNGPIVIAWDAARRDARHPERGHNVVFHEFAHKLDMLDGLVDGTPPLGNADAIARWREVCTAEYEALRDGTDDGFLDGYAATDPGEFFAVATEVFFNVPLDVEARKPELYSVLRDFYRQDPADRLRRADTAAAPSPYGM